MRSPPELTVIVPADWVTAPRPLVKAAPLYPPTSSTAAVRLLLFGTRSVPAAVPSPVKSMLSTPSAGVFVSSVTLRCTPSGLTMLTASLAAGTPDGDQLPAVFQLPLPAAQFLVAA